MRQTISVRFFARKGRATQGGLVPVLMRIGIGERRISITTKIYVKGSDWSVPLGKLKGSGEDARRINHLLEGFKLKAFDYQRELMNEGSAITLENMRCKWYGISHGQGRMLMDVFRQHNEQMEKLVGREYAARTLERYATSYSHTCEFMKWKYKKEDIDVRELKYEFISDYEFWLKSERNCDHNTTMKYLSNFRKIVNICIKNGWLTRDPFYGYKMTKREVERPFLVQEELDAIAEKQFSTDRVNRVRDIFLFSCYTGLAYADVKKLTREEITKGIDGKDWIWTNRQKTDTRTRVPLLPQALSIMARYQDDAECGYAGKLLPVLSNQKMNSYLKEIADVCGINKKMTFHTARHTFATTVTLSNGVPIETVSKLLGHRNLKTTQHYARILDQKISEDMDRLRRKLGGDGKESGEAK